jgi:hypothetical protein
MISQKNRPLAKRSLSIYNRINSLLNYILTYYTKSKIEKDQICYKLMNENEKHKLTDLVCALNRFIQENDSFQSEFRSYASAALSLYYHFASKREENEVSQSKNKVACETYLKICKINNIEEAFNYLKNEYRSVLKDYILEQDEIKTMTASYSSQQTPTTRLVNK